MTAWNRNTAKPLLSPSILYCTAIRFSNTLLRKRLPLFSIHYRWHFSDCSAAVDTSHTGGRVENSISPSSDLFLVNIHKLYEPMVAPILGRESNSQTATIFQRSCRKPTQQEAKHNSRSRTGVWLPCEPETSGRFVCESLWICGPAWVLPAASFLFHLRCIL